MYCQIGRLSSNRIERCIIVRSYINSPTEYNREHLKDKSVRGWSSIPIACEKMAAGRGRRDCDGPKEGLGAEQLLAFGVHRFDESRFGGFRGGGEADANRKVASKSRCRY